MPVDVEGMRGKRFVLAEELALLEAPPDPTPSVAFIAPFDSLLWDTALLASLFDFEYVWEGFFPPAKRRWGYYVLPIIFGDRFVGRIEPRIDRDKLASRCSTSGGRTASRRAAPTGSSTRCATRSAPTCASPAPTASTGRLHLRHGEAALPRPPLTKRLRPRGFHHTLRGETQLLRHLLVARVVPVRAPRLPSPRRARYAGHRLEVGTRTTARLRPATSWICWLITRSDSTGRCPFGASRSCTITYGMSHALQMRAKSGMFPFPRTRG